MSDTSIEWTDVTWNPVRGCRRVSPGCEHCYAERVAHRFSGTGGKYAGLTVVGNHGPRWAGQARFVPEKLGEPLTWRKPRKVFVNSMSDLFHEDVTFEQIAAVFGVMAACPQHTFQILTKRPDRAVAFFTWIAEAGAGLQGEVGETPTSGSPNGAACAMSASSNVLGPRGWVAACNAPWPLPNVWLGASCEDQPRADERVPLILQCPAAVHFVSAEPLLGLTDLSRYMWPVHDRWPAGYGSPEAARAAGAEVTRHRQALVSAHAVFLDWVIACWCPLDGPCHADVLLTVANAEAAYG
jgi:protein gp37